MTSELVGGSPRLPIRDDITHDVDLLDFEGDGDVDIFFTNAANVIPGGNLGDQLLLNQLMNGGTANFIEPIPKVTAPVTEDPWDTAVCDIDNDGDMDVVQAIRCHHMPNRLLVNQVVGGVRQFVDEASSRGMTSDSEFSRSVACHDVSQPNGTGGPDGFPEVFFGRRSLFGPLTDMYFTNDGAGGFTERTSLIQGDAPDSTMAITLCDVDGDSAAELFVANGELGDTLVPAEAHAESNRMFKRDPSTGTWSDAGLSLGFDFSNPGFSASVECADLDGGGVADIVLFGNTGRRNQLYKRQ